MTARARVRAFLLAMVVALFVSSVPWYRSPDDEVSLIWGLPDWVAVALGCYVAAAVLNAVAWLLTDISDPGEP